MAADALAPALPWHQQPWYYVRYRESVSWRRHQMETFSALLAICGGNSSGPRWTPLHKGQWRGALMFSLICAWINGWVNNGEAGDLRCYYAHYDFIVMMGAHHGCETEFTWVSLNSRNYSLSLVISVEYKLMSVNSILIDSIASTMFFPVITSQNEIGHHYQVVGNHGERPEFTAECGRKTGLIFHLEAFQLSAPSPCWEMIEIVNRLLCFLNLIQHDKG